MKKPAWTVSDTSWSMEEPDPVHPDQHRVAYAILTDPPPQRCCRSSTSSFAGTVLGKTSVRTIESARAVRPSFDRWHLDANQLRLSKRRLFVSGKYRSWRRPRANCAWQTCRGCLRPASIRSTVCRFNDQTSCHHRHCQTAQPWVLKPQTGVSRRPSMLDSAASAVSTSDG